MKIRDIQVTIIGEGKNVNPDKGLIEPLAVIQVLSDEGLTGWSESFRVPPGVAKAVLHGPDSFFGRHLIGETLTHPERLWQKLYDAMLHYNRRGWSMMCLGAVDVAIWDLYGKAEDQPVYQLLGGAQRGYFHTPESHPEIEIVPYCTLVSDEWDNEAMIRMQVDRAVRLKNLGYRGFKAEPMMSTEKNIIELARRARKELGPDVMLAVDVGYRFHDVSSTLKICRVLEELDVYFYETPFPIDSPEPYARLASLTTVPLAMGEHGVSRWEFLRMIDEGNVDVVQPYMNTCGGITEAKRIVEQARDRGAQVIPGNWSTQILGAATVQLAAYSPITPYIEFAPAEVYESPLRLKIQELAHPVVNGAIQLPTRPGIGIELPQDLLDHYRMDI